MILHFNKFLFIQVMQKSCRFSFMYGELTDKNTISALNDALETHRQEQYEILLYKKNRKSLDYHANTVDDLFS